LPPGGGEYSLLDRLWECVWTYPSVNTSSFDIHNLAVNHIIIHKRQRGNDYGKQFLFLCPIEAQRDRDIGMWRSGIDL
jgi:hypothetical protein